jgi:hypothetical protein
MKNLLLLLMVIAPLSLRAAEDGWISLFNGKDLSGWKASENPGTFTVENGSIVARGPRSHCFYLGDVGGRAFRDFELRLDVMTLPKANGGIFVMTEYQETGWPAKGFEIQVNNSFPTDPRRTGSLYQVQDVTQELVKDNVWFTEHIIVKGNTIAVRVNDKEVVRWTQPEIWNGVTGFPARRIGPGTIALQGHDPGSTVYYRNIQIRPLK